MQQPPSSNDPQDTTRLVRFFAMAMAIFLAYHIFVEKPQQAQKLQEQQAQQKTVAAAPLAEKKTITPRPEALAATQRIPVHGDKVTGSISLTGGRIDDLSLNDQYATVQKTEHVNLLSPSGTADAYYVESGWTSDDKTAVLPDEKTVWNLAPGSASTLTSGGSVTLHWDNGHGLVFERNIALDQNYLFTVTQNVANKTGAAIKLNAWHLISRHNIPTDFKGFFILHEGPLADLNDKLQELSYKDLDKGKKLEQSNTHGWLGITDKYWFVGILPPPNEEFDARIIGNKTDTTQSYQADIVSDVQTAEPGQSITDKKFIFVGVKNLNLMTTYHEQYGLPHMDLTFDFGLFYIVTKPFFYLLHFLMHSIGNVGLAILAMTVIIRGAMFPLANKSFRSMAGMKKIAPQLKELQEKYKDNREKLQMEIFELYKKEDVNPFSGCWPLLVQIPVFFALYKSILLSVELRHAPFWGWIHDLSAADPTNIFNLFGLIPWNPPAALAVGAWPCLFCLTMIIQKRLTPPMPDKTQEMLQSYFPFIITIMLAKFAAGLVIYWTWSNLLGVLQQYYILRKVGGQEVSLIRGHSERQKKKKPPANG